MIVSCECGAKLKIDETKIAGRRVKIRCPRCGNMLPVSAASAAPAAPAVKKAASSPAPAQGGHLVLVAHDSEMVRTMVSDVLTGAGFRVEMAADGVEALQKANEARPDGIVVDVGLPGIYGFELCERLKNNKATAGIKIVLLSSVYDARRYKRTPASLYGADDYIEKHHIPDALAAKFQRLLSPSDFPQQQPHKETDQVDLPEMSRPPAREFASSLLNHEPAAAPERETPAPAIETKQHAAKSSIFDGSDGPAITPESLSLEASIFQKEECDIPRVDAADPDAVEKAKRFARIIVSDVALYNQAAVIEGIQNGTFYDLLKDDITEGRELYEKRVPASIKARKDYYQEAFDNFIAAATKKKNVR